MNQITQEMIIKQAEQLESLLRQTDIVKQFDQFALAFAEMVQDEEATETMKEIINGSTSGD